MAALPRKEWSAAEDELIKDGVVRLGCRWRVIAAMLPGRSDDAVRNRWSRLQDSTRASASKEPKPGLDGTSNQSAAGDGNGGREGGSADGRGGGCEGKGAASEPGRHDGKGDPALGSAPKSLSRSSSKSNAKLGADTDSGSGSKASRNDQQVQKKERTSWTRSEDDVIMQGVSDLGHKWYEIARRLPGRTDHAIRNRWSRLQSIMWLQAKTYYLALVPWLSLPSHALLCPRYFVLDLLSPHALPLPRSHVLDPLKPATLLALTAGLPVMESRQLDTSYPSVAIHHPCGLS